MKGLRVTKIVKEIKFERIWDEPGAKKYSQRQSLTKYWRLTLGFHVKQRTTGKVEYLFFKGFLLVLTKFLF